MSFLLVVVVLNGSAGGVSRPIRRFEDRNGSKNAKPFAGDTRSARDSSNRRKHARRGRFILIVVYSNSQRALLETTQSQHGDGLTSKPTKSRKSKNEEAEWELREFDSRNCVDLFSFLHTSTRSTVVVNSISRHTYYSFFSKF